MKAPILRFGIEYHNHSRPIRVIGLRGQRLGDTKPDPGSRVQTYWFSDLDTWERHRRTIFEDVTKGMVAYPVPVVQLELDSSPGDDVEAAKAQFNAGCAGQPLTKDQQPSPMYLLGQVFTEMLNSVEVAQTARLAREEKARLAQIEAARIEAETAAAKLFEMEVEQGGKGAEYAKAGLALPEGASEPMRLGFEAMTQALDLEKKKNEPQSAPIGRIKTAEELQQAREEALKAGAAAPVTAEQALKEMSTEGGEQMIKPTPAPSTGSAPSTPSAPLHHIPVSGAELDDLISAKLAERAHRLMQLADVLKIDATALRTHIEAETSKFMLKSGGWVEFKA